VIIFNRYVDKGPQFIDHPWEDGDFFKVVPAILDALSRWGDEKDVIKIFEAADVIGQQGIKQLEGKNSSISGRRMGMSMDLVGDKEKSDWAKYFNYETGNLNGNDAKEIAANRASVNSIFLLADRLSSESGISYLTGTDPKSAGRRISIAAELISLGDRSKWAKYFDRNAKVIIRSPEAKADVILIFNITYGLVILIQGLAIPIF